MDRLSSRYACPFFICDEFIELGQFHYFVNEFGVIVAEEEREKYQWEFFLHKVFDKSYAEYLKTLVPVTSSSDSMSSEKTIDIVNDSRSLLDSF